MRTRTCIDFYKNAIGTYRVELQKENVGDDQDIEAALKAFEATGNDRVCPADQAYWKRTCSEQSNKILDLYDREWGKWRLNADGKLLFENPAAVDDYRNAVNAFNEDAAKQKVIQGQLLQKVESHAIPALDSPGAKRTAPPQSNGGRAQQLRNFSFIHFPRIV